MTEIKTVKLSVGQIQQLVNMIETGNFKGSNAWQVVELLENLREGLGDEKAYNKNRDQSIRHGQSKGD